MKILKINPNRPETEHLNLAAEVLSKDGLIVYPTDTLYGLGSNALSKKAVEKIYEVKGRDYKKSLSTAFYSLSQAKKYVRFNSIALKLARKLLPGPLTIVLPMKYKFPKELTFGSKNIGIRIPDNGIALNLIKKCRFPITSTSANISGSSEPITAKDAISQIGERVDLIIDGGKCKFKKPSTVIELIDDEVKILRKGVISEKSINRILK